MTCKTTLFLLAVIGCMTSGCATMMPYGDAYDCPQMEKGRCVSVESAHTHALTGAMPGDERAKTAVTAVNSGEALGEAIEKYRKAVVKGKADAIELSRNELLRLVSPGQADELIEALGELSALIHGTGGPDCREPSLKSKLARRMLVKALPVAEAS